MVLLSIMRGKLWGFVQIRLLVTWVFCGHFQSHNKFKVALTPLYKKLIKTCKAMNDIYCSSPSIFVSIDTYKP
jgi:hypothetical protein